MTRKLILWLVMLAVGSPMLVLTGCNTVQGAGADIESGGKAIKNEARENKHY